MAKVNTSAFSFSEPSILEKRSSPTFYNRKREFNGPNELISPKKFVKTISSDMAILLEKERFGNITDDEKQCLKDITISTKKRHKNEDDIFEEEYKNSTIELKIRASEFYFGCKSDVTIANIKSKTAEEALNIARDAMEIAKTASNTASEFAKTSIISAEAARLNAETNKLLIQKFITKTLINEKNK